MCTTRRLGERHIDLKVTLHVKSLLSIPNPNGATHSEAAPWEGRQHSATPRRIFDHKDGAATN
ncbi:UNVERIFIED_ORG: hypothetical protein FNL38_105126 [Nocardia globerula]|uniref:Uncharacterized protein n=1 Tax=Nocardia globerula TaxID=1818 RepID=A0A652YN01_NOCGL|nr:hypothetical protein C8E04_3034 [Rhodococcus globerulus]